MTKSTNYFSRVLGAFLLCAGFVLAGCVGETMSVPVTGVTLDTERMELVEGETGLLNATISPSNATNKNLLWISSNSSIVTVSEGVVNALKPGSANVTVKTDDGGKIAICAVVVKSKDEGENEGNNGGNESGEVAGPLTWSLGKVTATTATFTGHLDVAAADLSSSQVTVYYSDAKTFNMNSARNISTTSFDNKQNYTITLTNLKYNTKYNYCMVAEVKSERIYGDVLEFTTLRHPYDIQHDLNVSAATNLSSSGSANCYIISESGLYKFKPVKGNSNEPVAYDIDDIASASVLWETFGTDITPEPLDLIGGVCYKDGYIVFQTADTFKEGNAVIAAKSVYGSILWSWHIWFTDQPQGQVYYNNAGTMMDRNLGATSATPGDVGALGLLYQWGRKDPFLGSSSISSEVEAKSTITWPSAVETSSSVGTVDYVTYNPTTFVKSSSSKPNDWHYYQLPPNNTLWNTSAKTKSIYDPCPAGWRVPNGGSNGVWSKALGSSSEFNSTYDSTNEGINFSGKFGSDLTIWYPSSCHRRYSDGRLYLVGNSGNYWSASPDGDYAEYLGFWGNGLVRPSDNDLLYPNPRADGFSVRCLQE